MKKVLVIFILLLVVNLINSQESASSTAIVEIANNFFINQSIKFDFYIHQSRDKRIDKILSNVGAPVNIKVIDFEKTYAMDQSAILIFNETKWVMKFHRRMGNHTEKTQPVHLFVYIENFKLSDLQKLAPKNHLRARAFYENFLIDLGSENFIKLVTFTSFQQPDCRQLHPLTINRFSKVQKKWKTQKFQIDRFNNFNGCEQVVGGLKTNSLFTQIHKIVESKLNFKSSQYGLYMKNLKSKF
jgi:hypothetical protein